MKASDQLVDRFLIEAKKVDVDIFRVGSIELEKSVANYMWERVFFSHDKEIYSRMRKKKEGYHQFLERIWIKKVMPKLPDHSYKQCTNNGSEIVEKYAVALRVCTDAVVFFCLNKRQFDYYLPVLKEMKTYVVILTMVEIDEHLLDNNNIRILEFDIITNDIYVSNDYLQQEFPYIFYLANTFRILIHGICPRVVFLLEGCHADTEVLAAVCYEKGIKTVCIQQGWPSLMHTRFTNMRYDFFLTWGKAFNKLWKDYNPKPIFKEIGYLYEVKKISVKKGITFFFQAPLFIINLSLMREMLEFAFYCAKSFDGRAVYIREHPEYKLEECAHQRLQLFPNIKVVTDMSLSEVYAITEVGVSVFSSTLVEGLLHGTIPFIFNLTSNPSYFPDLEEEKIGVEARTYPDAITKIYKLINDPDYKNQILNCICRKKNQYFDCYGDNAVNNIISFIQQQKWI